MFQKPSSGEIEIDGGRWRWSTVGHSRGSARGERSDIRWTISFSDAADPKRRRWCEMPDRSPDDLGPPALRELFRRASGDA